MKSCNCLSELQSVNQTSKELMQANDSGSDDESSSQNDSKVEGQNNMGKQMVEYSFGFG